MSPATACPRCGTPLVSPGAACPACPPATPSATLSLPGDDAPATGSGGATATAPDSAPPAEGGAAPARYGRFEVRGLVGEGVFGEVYRAYDPQLDRDVALKVAKPGTVGSGHRARRFLREAKAAANLRHPHIVPLYETGEDAGRYFLVAAFIDGRTLGDVIDAARGRGGLPPAEAAALARKLASALAYAHGEGVVHRDVKPDNVMVDGRGEPHLLDFGLAARGEAGDEKLTQVGALVGTPAYMSPEQARGDADRTGPTSDQYSLGCVLYELLTGRAPFTGPPAVQMMLHQNQPVTRPRALRPDVPRDLETIVLKCLEKDPAKRYPDCQAVADDLRRWQEDEPIVARRPGPVERTVRWVRRNPGWAAAVAAGVLVLVGTAVTTVRVQQVLADRQVAAESQRADDRIAAEEKRLADLRQARADSLVRALTEVETAAVPRVLADLTAVRDLAGARLREMAAQPITTKPGLHARLALLADEPHRAAELAAYVPECRAEELLPVRGLLAPHAAAVAPGLWSVTTDAQAGDMRRVRAAAALAELAAQDSRWQDIAPAVVNGVVRSRPGEFVVWVVAFEPVRLALLPDLLKRYPAAQGRIRSGKLDESKLVAEASGFDLTAALQVRYLTDRPVELAQVASTVDSRHFPLFAPALAANRERVLPLLRAELVRKPLPDWAIPPADGIGSPGGYAMAAAVGPPGRIDALDPDPILDAAARRRANTATALLLLGEPDPVWQACRYPADGDPTTRSYLLARLAAVNTDPLLLIRRFAVEDDVSARRALLVALGDYPPAAVPTAERDSFVTQLLKLYSEHPDPGLHGAIDWLLRQRWDRAAAVKEVDSKLAVRTRQSGAGGGPGVGMRWYVTGTGQTYFVSRPVEFTFGSPVTEPGRFPEEFPHRRRIGRSFAVATREVTVAEFLRVLPAHVWDREYTPEDSAPAITVTWYEAAEYCNRLSEQEGIPEREWCYERNEQGKYAEGMRTKPGHLRLSGYRLPTGAEWEYSCRAGAGTSRPYGRGDDLLPRYAWGPKNSDERTWPVGQLRPNDFGLFDTLGNAEEWVQDPYFQNEPPRPNDEEYGPLEVVEQQSRILRGGAYRAATLAVVRSAIRHGARPGLRINTFGFRPARTIPE